MRGQLKMIVLMLVATTNYGADAPDAASGRASGKTETAATLLPNAELQAALAATNAEPVMDTVLRVVAVQDEYNIGISTVRRAKVHGMTPPDAIRHHAITEVYHVLEGSGILVTGGVIEGEADRCR